MAESMTPREMREWLHAQYPLATTDEQRSRLLDLHRELNDSMERQLTNPEALEQLREVRSKDYRLLLVSEVVDQEGNASPELLARVTEREVRAGRMAEDDELRVLARQGMQGAATNDQARADLALSAAIQGARSMLATQQPMVDAAGFDYSPVFTTMITRLYLMGVMWRLAEGFDLPLEPRLRNSPSMQGYLVGEGMNERRAALAVQQLNGIARPNDHSDDPVVLAGYHADLGDGSLAQALQAFRNEPQAAGRPWRIIDRSKPIAAAIAVVAFVLALALGQSWPVSIGVGVVAGIIPLGIALGVFHWITRRTRR